MTIESLCGLDADELKLVIDSGQLAEIAKEHNWLNITRPELAPKPDKKSTVKSIVNTFSEEKKRKLQRAQEIANQFGFSLDE